MEVFDEDLKKNDMVLNSYCFYMYLNINKIVI